jgi:tRNA threonylcarbamoyladenosine modification (KEOPS) complex  Pcc1 subunit|tara:strand:- start:6121 stop:6360 length:240 start_codon:yes stop_codon:yes gene_type:complete
MIKSTIILSGSKRYLKLFYESLLPEQNFKNDKGFYEMNLEKDLKINITAKDVITYRAIVTNLAGLMSIVQKTWNLKNGK